MSSNTKRDQFISRSVPYAASATVRPSISKMDTTIACAVCRGDAKGATEACVCERCWIFICEDCASMCGHRQSEAKMPIQPNKNCCGNICNRCQCCMACQTRMVEIYVNVDKDGEELSMEAAMTPSLPIHASSASSSTTAK